MENTQKNNTQSITVKLLIVVALIIGLLIPSFLIMNMIKERKERRDETINEVTSKWGSDQTISGPVITVPYYTYQVVDKKTTKYINYAHFLPQELNIEGVLHAEERYRGIYKVTIYDTKLDVSGYFDELKYDELGISGYDMLWDKAFLTIGITDNRGINEKVTLQLNDRNVTLDAGVKNSQVISRGLSSYIKINGNSKYDFSFSLNLNGSRSLQFLPFGDVTNVKLVSDWTSPSFNGAFLAKERTVNNEGFKAEWNILQLNRNYPNKWTDYMDQFSINESLFGVDLIIPVDTYQKTMRSAKYAILFIALTFLVFLFAESLNKKRIHPIYYVLIGLALLIFYSLLLALSEHIKFNYAYLISTVAVIGLISSFTFSLFKNKKVTFAVSSLLVLLYAFLFTILQLSDFALLIGNIGLFVILAVAMYFSRKVEWYGRQNVNHNEK